MSNQELLTYLFNAIALGFLFIASMDLCTRILALYREVFVHNNNQAQQPTDLTLATHQQQELPQIPDPWLLPSLPLNTIVSVNLEQKELVLRLLPPAKESAVVIPNPVSKEMLAAIDLGKLKLREARKIAKVLGIAQKVNGRDQKLDFLKSQIKLRLQQAKSEAVHLVAQELFAS